MSYNLDDVFSESVSADDLKTWLFSDSPDKDGFINYFLNFVKDSCAWIVCKTDKSNSSPSLSSTQNDSSCNQPSIPVQKHVYKENDKYIKHNVRNNNRVTNDAHQYIRNDQGYQKSDHSARKTLNFKPKLNNSSVKETPKVCPRVPDINSLDAFPPFNAEQSPAQQQQPKNRRRITPTPVQTATSQFGDWRFTAPKIRSTEDFKPVPVAENPGFDLKKEREMLKITRKQMSDLETASNNMGNQKSENFVSPAKPCVAQDFIVPDRNKVTFSAKIEKLADIYSTLISHGLVPNVTSELYFVFELITSNALPSDKCEKKDSIFCSVHNCVFFSVAVLKKVKFLLRLLDNFTLHSLKEIPFLFEFSNELVEDLRLCSEESEELSTKARSVGGVPFILEEDSLGNFANSHAFSSFRKQRDLFYELLREWQQQQFDQRFKDSFGRKARNLVNIAPDSVNLHHLAKLIQNQMVASCLGLEVKEIYDEMLKGVQKNFPGKMEKLQQRFLLPFFAGGPSPAPMFYGPQLFFSELIEAASSVSLNQHLQDILVAKIVELNSGDVFSDLESSSMTTLREEYGVLLQTLRILAKFLGFLHFLPYKNSQPVDVSNNILNHQLAWREKSVPPIDMLTLLKSAAENRRVLLTVPWVVEYLSMVDPVGKSLQHVEEVLKLLNVIYLRYDAECDSYNFWFLRILIGWLFDVLCYPVKYNLPPLPVFGDYCQKNKAIDNVITVNKQLIHSCCPYLVEFKVLIYSFLNGLRKNKKEIRKITPISTSKPSAISAEHQLQSQLLENFFFLHPPSLKKTVTFISERIASKTIQKIRLEVTDFKLQSVENITNLPEYKNFSNSSPSKKKRNSFLESHILNLYRASEARVSSLIQSQCLENIKTIMPFLLSDDIDSSVLEMSCDIAFGLAQKKILAWCEANLIFKDIKQDILNKLNHLSKGEEVSEDDFNMGSWLTSIRGCVLGNLSDNNSSCSDLVSLLVEASFLLDKPIGISNKKMVVFLSIDLYVSVLTNSTSKCTTDFEENFVSVLSKCHEHFNLESYFISGHNVKLLSEGKNIRSICENLISILLKLVEEKVFKVENLKECLKAFEKQQWHSMKASLLLKFLSQMPFLFVLEK